MPRKSDGEELAEVAFLAVSFCITLLVLCGRASATWTIALISRTFRAYGGTHAVQIWLLASATTIGSAVLIALLTRAILAYLAVGGLTVASLLTLALVEQVLNRLASLPPHDATLPLDGRWDRD